MDIKQLARLRNRAEYLRILSQSDNNKESCKECENIYRTLLAQSYMLEDIRERQSWLADFSSNIAGNAVYDGILYLFTKLLKK